MKTWWKLTRISIECFFNNQLVFYCDVILDSTSPKMIVLPGWESNPGLPRDRRRFSNKYTFYRSVIFNLIKTTSHFKQKPITLFYIALIDRFAAAYISTINQRYFCFLQSNNVTFVQIEVLIKYLIKTIFLSSKLKR